MKVKNLLEFILFLSIIAIVSLPVSAGEVVGDGTNGFFVHSMSPNIGLFGMELTDSIPFHGYKSQTFWISSLGDGSVKIRKTYIQPIPRGSYTECLAFKRLCNLLPEVSNVYVETLFYVSADGINFFHIGTSGPFGRGSIGGWAQCIMGFQNNAPATITHTQIEFQVFYTGTPSSDSIRSRSGLDYWNFSFYSYPMVMIDDFEGIPSGITQNQNGTLEKFNLGQNYPNPFNPTTKIAFNIPKTSNASLIVYDVLGEKVVTLADEKLNAGSYEIDFNASNLASGTYFYRLTAGDFIETKKMILMR